MFQGIFLVEETDFQEKQGIEDKVIGFFERYPLAVSLLTFIVSLLIINAVFFSSPSQALSLEKVFDFNYGPAMVYKTVTAVNGSHSEKIIVSSTGGAKKLSLFLLVPKSLAMDSETVSLSSSGKISVLKKDPVFLIGAVGSDSIAVQFSLPSNSNACSLLVVMHEAVVAAMSQEQLDNVIESISEKESLLSDCEKANALETEIAQKIYLASTES